MKAPLLFLLITAGFSESIPWNSKDDQGFTTISSSSTESPSVPVKPTYDFVVEIGFNLNEDKMPEYIVDIIYDNSTEKSITVDDILSLYELKTIELDNIIEVFDSLGIQSQNVFSLDGFDKFLTETRLDFKEFYNKVIIGRLNITGYPLRDLLVALEIDINTFSMSMAYGDPDPYEVFKKGNFTKEAVDTALEKAGTTLEELFLACRDEFLSKATDINTENIIGSLLKYNFDKVKALKLWNVLYLNMENVYRVPAFKQLLSDLSRELNQNPLLGVLTSPNNITINRKAYETWRSEKDIVTLYVESISHKFILQITDTVDTELDNILILKSIAIEPYDEVALPYVEIGKSSGELVNCKFVTVLNGTLLINDVAVVTNHGTYLQMPKNNITELIPGSPLICHEKLYGIAREIKSAEIILDAFSGISRLIVNMYLLPVALSVCICVIFFVNKEQVLEKLFKANEDRLR
ncbi:hypothetical protein NQ318_008532 [Aromia moschata]|uniref:Uncharacterized protein n=1 Tax=Aromia moschata TaxID=1265417 RepID=A0AAV8YX94_9CUCU|nr:hypothetical protein NQ318_008532 [Aromia moschata]